MFSVINKLFFYQKKPSLAVVCGQGKETAAEAIFQTLKQNFKVHKLENFKFPSGFEKNDVLIFQAEDKQIKDLEFFLRNSQKAVLVVTHIGQIPVGVDLFSGEKEKIKETLALATKLPANNYLVLNYDDQIVREMDNLANLKTFTFGFDKTSDFYASDINLNSGTNFKVNQKGSVVPFWLENIFGKEQVYAALAAAVVGNIFDLNLVEISQGLRNYHSLPGKMKLLSGIKNSWILDDSESATLFSMIEAIEIMTSLQSFKRKIAVLGDVLGIGEYTIEGHEAIGEKVAKGADLLFVVGPRAKFISQEAREKGMLSEKIWQFDTIEEVQIKIQEQIQEGDLVLIDGSKEMEMKKIVEEIKGTK